jgi:hypothetical protein
LVEENDRGVNRVALQARSIESGVEHKISDQDCFLTGATPAPTLLLGRIGNRVAEGAPHVSKMWEVSAVTAKKQRGQRTVFWGKESWGKTAHDDGTFRHR